MPRTSARANPSVPGPTCPDHERSQPQQTSDGERSSQQERRIAAATQVRAPVETPECVAQCRQHRTEHGDVDQQRQCEGIPRAVHAARSPAVDACAPRTRRCLPGSPTWLWRPRSPGSHTGEDDHPRKNPEASRHERRAPEPAHPPRRTAEDARGETQGRGDGRVKRHVGGDRPEAGIRNFQADDLKREGRRHETEPAGEQCSDDHRGASPALRSPQLPASCRLERVVGASEHGEVLSRHAVLP